MPVDVSRLIKKKFRVAVLSYYKKYKEGKAVKFAALEELRL